jgi:hypothetical protein
MRRLLLFAGLLGLTACHRSHPGPVGTGSVLEFGDPKDAAHLDEGLYEIEANAWRWTARRFSIHLPPPARSAERGATLRLALTVPEPVIALNKEATLLCSANGIPTPPETWTTVGPETLVRDLPPIIGDQIRVECTVGKSIPPGPVDKRELGLIVRNLRIDPK